MNHRACAGCRSAPPSPFRFPAPISTGAARAPHRARASECPMDRKDPVAVPLEHRPPHLVKVDPHRRPLPPPRAQHLPHNADAGCAPRASRAHRGLANRKGLVPLPQGEEKGVVIRQVEDEGAPRLREARAQGRPLRAARRLVVGGRELDELGGGGARRLEAAHEGRDRARRAVEAVRQHSHALDDVAVAKEASRRLLPVELLEPSLDRVVRCHVRRPRPLAATAILPLALLLRLPFLPRLQPAARRTTTDAVAAARREL
mmetsp:Transcript_6951/g.15627  ORF Transcript_6951/g.15627 Transcript_6951/m.15627 type:complete len:260 (-) Transcript_6951:512-1291(-)